MARSAKDLSDDQIVEFKEAFALFDRDGNGTLDKKELRPVMCVLGQEPTQAEVDAWMTEFDVGKEGTLDVDEFIDMMAAKTSDSDKESSLREAFRVFDRDSDGSVTKDEFRAVMTRLGERLSDDEVDELIAQVDGDGNRELSYEEFKQLLGAA